MKRRPFAIIALAIIFLLAPFGNIIQGAIVNQIPILGEDGILHHLAITDWVILTLYPIIALSIYSVKKYSWHAFLVFSGVAIAYNFFVYTQNHHYSVGLILVFNVLFIGCAGVMFHHHIKAPYFDPRIRWWETDPRYKVQLSAEIFVDQSAATVQLLDVSRSGCFIDYTEELPLGGDVILTIKGLGNDIHCTGRLIRRSAKAESAQGYGVMFLPSGKVTRRALKALIFNLKRLGAPDRPPTESTGPIPLASEITIADRNWLDVLMDRVSKRSPRA